MALHQLFSIALEVANRIILRKIENESWTGNLKIIKLDPRPEKWYPKPRTPKYSSETRDLQFSIAFIVYSSLC